MIRFRRRPARKIRPCLRPNVECFEDRQLLSTAPVFASRFAGRLPARWQRPVQVPLQVQLSNRSAFGNPADAMTDQPLAMIEGTTRPRMLVGLDQDSDGRYERVARANWLGRFRFMVASPDGADQMRFQVMGRRKSDPVPFTLVGMSRNPERPFNGSPVAGGQPFIRIVPTVQSSGQARPDPAVISEQLAEPREAPQFSPSISLGEVFFGQFVDHDVTLMNVTGQGAASADGLLNLRTPALDLDSVYGQGGPDGNPQFYTPDGLFFLLGANGTDVLRDANGVAVIGDERNDDNGQIAKIHLAFQKYHNTLMTQKLGGVDPATLTDAQRRMLFDMVRAEVVGYHQGIVANQLSRAFIGQPMPRNVPPIENMPLEFSVAVFRLGHTLVPDRIAVDHQGNTLAPTDSKLRGPVAGAPFDLLFGPNAQPASAFDNRIAENMRSLSIPLSPNDPDGKSLIGGNSPNIGKGRIVDGTLRLDLIETNLIRSREQNLPSGEEYLAWLEGRPYNPETDGNTDLFVYMLNEATPLGHLGKVGTDIFVRTLSGVLSADSRRFDNPQYYTPEQISRFQSATFEGLLHAIGEPGF